MRVEDICARLWPGRECRVERLGGGLTNHNFKVTLGNEAFVVRVGGQDTHLLGIDRADEHGAALVAASIGVGPEVVGYVDGSLVTRFVDGAPVAADEISSPEAIGRVARLLRTIHDGPAVPGRFDSFRVVEAYLATVFDRGGRAPDRYEDAKAVADEIERGLGPRPAYPCHNDLLNANFIADGDRLWIVDWEYAGMGDPFFDLANFAVNNDLADDGDRTLLEAYGRTDEEALAHLTLMRFMSDFREAMWGAVQEAVSTLDEDFAAYSRVHFDRLDATARSPRFRAALAYVTQAQPSQ
ncbi:MAG TPA: choline/ethanolamine kinase family protein [Gaiellaceae bacterium]|nr:choline/ethanolamine kinase family protein [Gaiellaceae bacterium]